jgi:hypothetical protein
MRLSVEPSVPLVSRGAELNRGFAKLGDLTGPTKADCPPWAGFMQTPRSPPIASTGVPARFRGTDGLQTHRWRKGDSNCRSRREGEPFRRAIWLLFARTYGTSGLANETGTSWIKKFSCPDVGPRVRNCAIERSVIQTRSTLDHDLMHRHIWGAQGDKLIN